MVWPTVATAPRAKIAISAASSPYSSRSWPSSAVGNLRLARRISVSCAMCDCIGVTSASKNRWVIPQSGAGSVSTRPRSFPSAVLRGRAVQLAGDRLEDRADAATRRRHRRDRHERDQRDEQGVLEQVLAFFIANE